LVQQQRKDQEQSVRRCVVLSA